MSDISPISGSIAPPEPAAAERQPHPRATRRPVSEDSIEISVIARALSAMEQIPDIRAERVTYAREAIARGDYFSKDKLDHVVNRLLEEINA